MERRDFLKLAGFTLGTSVIACSGLNPTDFPAVVTVTSDNAKSEPIPSQTPEVVTANTLTAPTETPNPTPTEIFVNPKSPEAFYLQGVDFNRPHKIILPIETSEILGFGADEISHEDKPILSTEKVWTKEELDIMESAGIDNSNGNPFILVQSDLKGKILFFMAHSYQRSSIGEKVRLAGRFLIKNKTKAKADLLLGKPWNVQFNDDPTNILEGKIAMVENIPVDLFEDTWAQYSIKPNDPKFGRTDARGIPDTIRNDKRKGVFYIAYVSCISNDGDPHYKPFSTKYDTYENSRQRAMVVVEYAVNP